MQLHRHAITQTPRFALRLCRNLVYFTLYHSSCNSVCNLILHFKSMVWYPRTTYNVCCGVRFNNASVLPQQILTYVKANTTTDCQQDSFLYDLAQGGSSIGGGSPLWSNRQKLLFCIMSYKTTYPLLQTSQIKPVGKRIVRKSFIWALLLTICHYQSFHLDFLYLPLSSSFVLFRMKSY